MKNFLGPIVVSILATRVSAIEKAPAPATLDWTLIEDLEDRQRQLTETVVCDAPESSGEVYYVADLTLTTSGSVQCSQPEYAYIEFILNLNFSSIVSGSPVAVTLDATVCSSTGGSRQLHEVQVMEKDTRKESFNEKESLPKSWWNSVTEYVSVLQRRRLQSNRIVVRFYRGGGKCFLCVNDNRDANSRRLTNKQITVVTRTDHYPNEMSWTIEQGSTTVQSSGSFTHGGATKTETFTLAPGVYHFVAHDSYKDGWCCSYGEGSATVYLGDAVQDNVLASENGRFTSSRSTEFTVPSDSNGSLTTQSSTSEEAAFQDVRNFLEAQVSSAASATLKVTVPCLIGKDPLVSVQLQTASQSESEGICN